jgi:hypothetical protein
MRENVGWLIIYDTSIRKLLDDIWQESLSCDCDSREFIEWFRALSRHQFSSFVVKTCKPRAIDADSNNWPWIIELRNKNDLAKRKTERSRIEAKCGRKSSQTKSGKNENASETASGIGANEAKGREYR